MNTKRFPLTREITGLVLVYLYVPVLVLIAYSFNANRTATVWTHASLDWYGRVFVNPSIQSAALNSIILALAAATAATILALLAALAMRRAFLGRGAAEAVLNMPLILPEIVVAVATLLLFVSLGIKLGLTAMVLAHTAFCIPFAYLPIRARLESMDLTLETAAADLYATPWATFRRVTFPLLLPGIIAGMMLAFVTSLDDVVITVFVKSAGQDTLPTYMLGQIRRAVSTEVYAISTMLLGLTVVMLTAFFLLTRKKD